MNDELGIRKKEEAPRIAVLHALLESYTLEQLEQIASMSRRLKGREEMPDLVIRWKGGHPRWIGCMDWEEMRKP